MDGPHRYTVLRDSPRKRIAVLLFIISPLAVLTGLCWWMYYAISRPPLMNEPPKGAGAGHTGLSNEYMGLGKGRPAPAGTAAPTGTPAAAGTGTAPTPPR